MHNLERKIKGKLTSPGSRKNNGVIVVFVHNMLYVLYTCSLSNVGEL